MAQEAAEKQGKRTGRVSFVPIIPKYRLRAVFF
jgi:hypothetical protein